MRRPVFDRTTCAFHNSGHGFFFSGIARIASEFSASGERTCKLSAYWVAQIASVPHFYERHTLTIKALINQSINHDLISDQKSRKRWSISLLRLSPLFLLILPVYVRITISRIKHRSLHFLMKISMLQNRDRLTRDSSNCQYLIMLKQFFFPPSRIKNGIFYIYWDIYYIKIYVYTI